MPATVPASPPTTPPAFDLAARLALVDAVMAVRIEQARTRFEINTAYAPTPPTAAPGLPPPAPAPAVSPYSTPIADLLHRARNRIITDGWCRNDAYDESGAVCPIRAIRLEAPGDRHLADDACVLLLDSIQAELPDAQTIPSWNAAHASAAPVLAALDRAAARAHSRGA